MHIHRYPPKNDSGIGTEPTYMVYPEYMLSNWDCLMFEIIIYKSKL